VATPVPLTPTPPPLMMLLLITAPVDPLTVMAAVGLVCDSARRR